MSNNRFDLATSWDQDWYINGVHAKKLVREYLSNATSRNLHNTSRRVCPYCSQELTRKSCKRYEDGEGEKKQHDPFRIQSKNLALLFCTYCFYWSFAGYEGGSGCTDEVFLVSAASVAAKFSTIPPNGCNAEIAQQLRRNPSLWHTVNPRKMEMLVADVFRANHKHCEVIHVGGPGDLGVDVIFIDDNTTKWLIQVKRREKPNKAEGFDTLQSILGALALQGERHGIIVSTADYFSHQVLTQTKKAAEQGFIIKLVDKSILNRMIGKLLPSTPWRDLLHHPDLKIIMDGVEEYELGIGQRTSIDPDQLSLFENYGTW